MTFKTSSDVSTAELEGALAELFGYPAFRPGQLPVIEAVMRGEDVLAVMPTGAGKSLCYQLPAFLLPGCTVVISPLVALMKDQIDSLPPAVRARAAVFNSTIERETMDGHLADLAAGQLKLIYVAPERLRQRPFLHALARAQISRFVVDEAHCISLWGHDFRPDYFFIPTVLELIGGAPLLAMTATATPAVQLELQERFHRPLHLVHTGVLRPNLFLEVQHLANREQKYEQLLTICNEERGTGIIYASSRKNAEEAARFLRGRGVNARHYHAGLDSSERAAVQDLFMRGAVRVIVATVAFGMGVDKADVRFIVHMNPSRSLEAYAQESGRAGRDGEPARCVLFWASSDKQSLGRWAREDMLTPDLLRAVYRALRQGSDRFVWWPPERLVSAVTELGVPDVDETTIRVAIGALEQVGVLRRHCDLPETAQVRLLSSEGVDGTLVKALGNGAPGRYSRDMLDLSARLGVAPSDVEEELLRVQDSGALSYYGGGRGLLIELLPHPPDLAERLRGLLDGYERAQLERIAQIEAYATTRRCRTATIARHFGVEHPGRCEHCDNCLSGDTARPAIEKKRIVREQVTAAEPERAPEDLVIECIAELPFPMGRTGISRVLKGSVTSPVQADRTRHFGALAALTASAIEREIDRLIAAGFLQVRQVGPDPVKDRRIAVTPDGFAKPAAPWPPPRPMAVSQRAPRAARSAPRDADEVAVEPQGDDGIVAERFERLREWRREQVRGTNLPLYTVLNDDTLRRLSERRISSLADIGTVKGIGPAKLERYGEALLEMLAEPDEGQ